MSPGIWHWCCCQSEQDSAPMIAIFSKRYQGSSAYAPYLILIKFSSYFDGIIDYICQGYVYYPGSVIPTTSTFSFDMSGLTPRLFVAHSNVNTETPDIMYALTHEIPADSSWPSDESWDEWSLGSLSQNTSYGILSISGADPNAHQGVIYVADGYVRQAYYDMSLKTENICAYTTNYKLFDAEEGPGGAVGILHTKSSYGLDRIDRPASGDGLIVGNWTKTSMSYPYWYDIFTSACFGKEQMEYVYVDVYNPYDIRTSMGLNLLGWVSRSEYALCHGLNSFSIAYDRKNDRYALIVAVTENPPYTPSAGNSLVCIYYSVDGDWELDGYVDCGPQFIPYVKSLFDSAGNLLVYVGTKGYQNILHKSPSLGWELVAGLMALPGGYWFNTYQPPQFKLLDA